MGAAKEVAVMGAAKEVAVMGAAKEAAAAEAAKEVESWLIRRDAAEEMATLRVPSPGMNLLWAGSSCVCIHMVMVPFLLRW